MLWTTFTFGSLEFFILEVWAAMEDGQVEGWTKRGVTHNVAS